MDIVNHSDIPQLMIVEPAVLGLGSYDSDEVVGKSLTVLQQRFVSYCQLFIDPKDISKPIVIDLVDVFKAQGIQRITNTHIANLRKAVDELPEKIWSFKEKRADNTVWDYKCPFVMSIAFQENSNICEISYHPKLTPFYNELSNGSIVYLFDTHCRLKKSISQKMYLLAKACLQNNDNIAVKMEIQELLYRLDASKTPPRNVKSKILDPAINEINEEKLDISLRYDRLKTDGKYSHIILYITAENDPSDNIIDAEGYVAATIEGPRLNDNLHEIAPETEAEICRLKKLVNYEFLSKYSFENDTIAINGINALLEEMAAVFTTQNSRVMISKKTLLTSAVKDVFNKVNMDAVINVINRYLAMQDTVVDPGAYLRSSIYNELLNPTKVDEDF